MDSMDVTVDGRVLLLLPLPLTYSIYSSVLIKNDKALRH